MNLFVHFSGSLRQSFLRFSVLSALMTSMSGISYGQLGRVTPTQDSPARFVEAPRFIEQELKEAEDAINAERWSDAVVRLGDLLQRDAVDAAESDLAGQDFFLAKTTRRLNRYQHLTDSIMRKARRLVGELPKSAIETYELRYDALARETLDAASKTRDWNAVGEVRRKFFHTTAGFEASLLLAQHEMYLGHPLSASLLLDDLVKSDRAVSHLGDSIHAIHLAAKRLANRVTDEDTVPQSGEVTIDGEAIAWPEEKDLESWIDERFDHTMLKAGGESPDYAMFGGSADRNENSFGQMPLENLRWKVPMSVIQSEIQKLEKIADELKSGAKLPPPSVMPLRVGDWLLMRSTQHLYGVDYRTGKRVWNVPHHEPEDGTDDEPSGAAIGQQSGNRLLSQRVWNDLPYGQISSDGRRAFMLGGLNELDAASFNPVMGWRGTRPADNTNNTLVALELATEGKLLWRLGSSEGGYNESPLSDAFFLGPPLPLDGRLYVLAEIAGDIMLLCLDPATGDEQWRQQLASLEAGFVSVDMARRIAGATPSYHEGLLLCPTGAGAMVAVDLVDRTLRWGVNYRRKINMQQTMSTRGGNFDTTALMQRWHSGAAIATSDAVFVTPLEADLLFCFDLVTGTERFRIPRNQFRYLAGVRDGVFFMASSRGMSAYDAETGAEKWRTPVDMLSAGQQIVGRGVFGKEDYLIPASGNELIRLSLKDGKVLQRRSTRYALGNLVAAGGEIISQGPTTVVVARGEASLEPLVDAALKRDPKDLMALISKAELLLQRGDRRKALELLKTAGEIDAEDIAVRNLSVSAMLGMLRAGESDATGMVSELESMIDSSAQRLEFLALRNKNSLASGDINAAADRLIEMSSLLATGKINSSDVAAESVIDDLTRICKLDHWIAARMVAISKKASPEQLKQISKKVEAYIETKIEDSAKLSKALPHFPGYKLDAARRTQGRKHLSSQSLLLAERLGAGFNAFGIRDSSSLSNEQLMLLVDVYARGGMKADAQRLLDQLSKRDDDVDTDRLELLAENVQKARVLPSTDWDDKAGLLWSSNPTPRGFGNSTSQAILNTKVQSGDFFRGWQLVNMAGRQIGFRDPNGAITGFQVGLPGRPDLYREAIIDGGVMAIVGPGVVNAVDLFKVRTNLPADSNLWTRSFNADGGNRARRKSRTSKFGDSIFRYAVDSSRVGELTEFRAGPIIGDRLMVLHAGDLMAVSLKTSEDIWRNSAAPSNGYILTDGDRVAVVSASLERTAFFGLHDGEKLDEKPWEHGTIWAATRRYILCYTPTDDPMVYDVKVVDPFNDKVLLELTTTTANALASEQGQTFGSIVNGRYMTLLNTEGKLTVWDIELAKEVSSLDIDPIPELKKIKVMELDGQLIVTSWLGRDQPDDTTRSGGSHYSADLVHAISLADGSLNWHKDLGSTWGCTIAQPANSPVVLFSRFRAIHNSTGASQKEVDVMALDVRDGERLHERLKTEVPSTHNQVETRILLQPVQERVYVQIGNETLVYHFGKTDEEVEKEQAEREKEQAKRFDPFKQ